MCEGAAKANTALPSWRAPHKQLPFVYAGSAMAAGGGLTMIFTPVAAAGPSRKVAGAGIGLAVVRKVEHDHGILSEPSHEGRPGTLMRATKASTAVIAGLTWWPGAPGWGPLRQGRCWRPARC